MDFFIMQIKNKVTQITISAVLCAIGIIIPMLSPIKILLEPASFTLASHVAIMIAMFISPTTAVTVSLGTTLGFFIGGFPPVIVLRAATHVVFALTGALILKKKEHILDKTSTALVFSTFIAFIHAICEVLVVIPFYFGGDLVKYEAKGFFISVILLVGVGTLVHSTVDFILSLAIWRPIRKHLRLS